MKKITYYIASALITSSFCISYGQETETRIVQPFEEIKTDGLVQVYLKEGDKESLRIEVKGIGLKDIITTVESKKLTVKTQGEYHGEEIKVYATYQKLKSIEVAGASKVTSDSPITGKHLMVATRGAGDALLNVEVSALTISMEGAGNLTIAGNAKSVEVDTKRLLTGTLDRTGLNKAEQ